MKEELMEILQDEDFSKYEEKFPHCIQSLKMFIQHYVRFKSGALDE